MDESQLLVKLSGCIVSVNVAENNFIILSVFFHHLKDLCCRFVPEALPLITLIDEELTKIICSPVIKIMIHRHTDGQIIIINPGSAQWRQAKLAEAMLRLRMGAMPSMAADILRDLAKTDDAYGKRAAEILAKTGTKGGA